MTELFSVTGTITGTGVISLRSDLYRDTVTELRIPQGLKIKVWCKRIAGEAAIVEVQYTRDVTASPPTWVTQMRENLATAGELTLEKRRPVVCRGFTGKEAVRVNRLTGTGDTSVDLEVELTKEE